MISGWECKSPRVHRRWYHCNLNRPYDYHIPVSPTGPEWLTSVARSSQLPTIIMTPERETVLAQARERIDRQLASNRTYHLSHMAPGAYDLPLHDEVVGSVLRSGLRQPTWTAELL